jgi:hypothetical protein
MQSGSKRLSIYVPRETEAVAKAIAAQRQISVNAVFRLALGVLKVHEEARAAGQYVGTTRDREALDQVIVAPL